ncbi:lipopolysaccharide biosynthesis protein RfbH [Methanosphaera sp. Vir-13MRS]|uniref:lipopolysaccharide biosynthesis protein RfbH n=1 Tax=Candidatus Methanosphaera massiliense TaxID=3017187 RepID=UPI00238046E4|nr:lipopolysaccharide biosynthesis protein RfbH [Candidatus Methanosphaera massiliense]MDE4078802.1 lipopolysaccharide biosynthesis protein RfbH [Candidatus Methanosphaera massiliense]
MNKCMNTVKNYMEVIKIFENKTEGEARKKILELVKEYTDRYHNQEKPFKQGDRISYASRVYDHDEVMNLVDSALEFWLTSGRYTEEFEKKLAEYLGVTYCSFVNSGSSANLLAFMSLTSPLLEERQVKPGDEVITVAAGFPTTVAPIIQYGAVPVFVDVTIPQYNIDAEQVEEAITDKTKAIMVAHTLGNPFNLEKIVKICKKYNLWLIEDNCDALGSTYTIDGKTKLTGTVGDIGTSSFYPPHHMTTGEGGAIYTNNPLLNRIVRSFRDWGRDCQCAPGQDNFCGNRFTQKYGELPVGYDHKYVYSHFGYNLKATDMQAAVGCAQLDKFPSFVERRKQNFKMLYEGLKDLDDKLILPEKEPNSDPSWFGFMITVKDNLNRNDIVQYLETHGVQTRMLFAGNLIKHPCFDQIRGDDSKYRVIGNLENTDKIMKDTFWIGVYPGMTNEKLDYMIKCIKEAINQ